MRLWHKDLIPYLPKQQLLGQWRELNSIYKLQNRHILIDFVYYYPKEDLLTYSTYILLEFNKRHYGYSLENFDKYFGKVKKSDLVEEPFKGKFTDRYLKQCLYNLQEKYDCNGISKEEWQIIEDRIREYLGE